METRKGRDGALEVRFSPPVGVWNVGGRGNCAGDAVIRVWWILDANVAVDLLHDESLPESGRWTSYPRLCKLDYHLNRASTAFRQKGRKKNTLDVCGVCKDSFNFYGHSTYDFYGHLTPDTFTALSAFRVVNPWPGKSYDEQIKKMEKMENYRASMSGSRRIPGGRRHDLYWHEGARLHLVYETSTVTNDATMIDDIVMNE